MNLKDKQKIVIFLEIIVFFLICFGVYSFFSVPLPSETFRNTMLEQENLKDGNDR